MTHFTMAANNAQTGGGEVMLLAIGHALRDLGHTVSVVAPAAEDGVGAEAARQGFPTTAILASGRREYMRGLRRWDASRRQGVLWCNGHVPALATAGHRDRVVHLHQAPSVVHVVAGRLAGYGALVTLVPSRSTQTRFPDAQILPNWTDDIRVEPHVLDPEHVVLGFLGRPSPDKGVVVLARALAELDAAAPGRFRLLLAGEPRFVGDHEQQVVEAALAPVSHLVDRVGWARREDFFSAIDLAVLPSVWAEPFGLTAAEAMSAGVPFVVSDAGALPEVAGERYPWTARSGSASHLAQVVSAALAAPEQTRRAVAAESRRRWEQHFSAQAGRRHLRFLLTDILPVALKEQA